MANQLKSKANPELYGWLISHDVLSWLEPLWKNQGWILRESDGKLYNPKRGFAIDTPWVHYGHNLSNQCGLWSHIIFSVVSQRMGQLFDEGRPFVPSGCQSCYKVVARPQNICQVFAWDEILNEWQVPSKLGLESRPSVPAFWGSYFYCRSLEEGKARYQQVRERLDNSPDLGPDVPALLKRGCTEMEHLCGPSNLWEITEEQKQIERLISDIIDYGEAHDKPQPDAVIWRVKRRWIEWAYEHNDLTYLQLTGGKPIFPPYVTYHEENQLKAIGDT